MKRKLLIILNSFFLFLSAFIFTKLLLITTRFVIIRSFGGKTQLIGFNMECVDHPYAPIWNVTSVISIYLSDFISALILAFFAYAFYTYFKRKRGFIKLWLIWFYIIAINQSIGSFIRDIPFKRDIYHALNWMHIPYEAMIVFSFLTLFILFFVYRNNYIKFLRMSAGKEDYLKLKSRRSFYTQIALIPAILGIGVILLLQYPKFRAYEYVEAALLLSGVAISYVFLFKEKLLLGFRVAWKNNPGYFSYFATIAAAIALFAFFYIRIKYY